MKHNLNKKTILKKITRTPDIWHTIESATLAEKKLPKHQNAYKALYVKARYWAKTTNCQTRIVLEPPTAPRTHHRAHLQIIARTPQTKPTTQLNNLIKELTELIEETTSLRNIATQLQNKTTPPEKTPPPEETQLQKTLTLIIESINTQRLKEYTRPTYAPQQKPTYKREDY